MSITIIAMRELRVMVESSLIKTELVTMIAIVPPKSSAIVTMLVFYSKGHPRLMDVRAPRTR